jgi:hypothetical protein
MKIPKRPYQTTFEDQIVGHIDSLSIATAKGEDLERLALLVGVQLERCPRCNAPRWRRLLFFPFYWLHKRRCKHERLWRDIVAGRTRGISIGATVRRTK